MKIDIVCPLFRAKNYIDDLLHGLKEQENIEIDNLVFPITESEDCESII